MGSAKKAKATVEEGANHKTRDPEGGTTMAFKTRDWRKTKAELKGTPPGKKLPKGRGKDQLKRPPTREKKKGKNNEGKGLGPWDHRIHRGVKKRPNNFREKGKGLKKKEDKKKNIVGQRKKKRSPTKWGGANQNNRS